MDVKLISISPKGTRKVFPLVAPVTVFGRQADCDLQIQLGEISRQHCEIQTAGSKVILKDRDSANGTFVNGQKITEQELKAGDVFSLANAINFVVQIDGKPVNIDESKLRRVPTPAAPEPAPAKKAVPSKPKPTKAPEPSPSFAATSAGPTDKDDADQILGDSFFMDLEDEEEEEKEKEK
jgi:pSer/pThr/pTyr-binding forkhead associated (FHA) protein